MSDAHARLIEMFEANFNSMTDKQWFDAFPAYEGDIEVGSKLYWPPLSEVWTCQGEIPADVPKFQRERWADAWALLSRLHSDYLAAKERRA